MAVNVRGGGPLSFEATISAAQFDAQISKIQMSLEKLTTTAEAQAKSVDSLVSKTATAIAGYLSIATATNFIGQIVKVRGEFQQLEVAFTTMLKNKGAADLLLAQAVELAAKTPFTLQDVGNASKQLLAYGFAANEVTDNLTMLGNIASGVGAPLGDIVYLYGTLRTQGQVFTRDLLQFTSRGIPIVSELAKQFGVAESEVKGMVEAGKVGFPDVEKAFRNLTSEGGTFFNLMEEQSKTLTGQLSNLEDAWSRMLNDIGKGSEGLLSGAISTATSLVNNYQEIIKIIKVLIATYGSYRASLLITNALSLTQAELTAGVTIAQKLHAAAVGLADRAMKFLNATMLSNPFVAVATALGAVVTALIVFKKESNGVASAQELIQQGMEETNAKYDEQQAKVRALLAQLKAGNLTEQQRLDIYEKLKAINPSIVSGLNAQSISYQNITANVEDYLTSLRKQIQLEANSTALTGSIQKENSIKSQIEQQEKLVKSLEKVDKGYRGVVGGSSFGTNTGSTGSTQRLAVEQGKLNDLQKQYDEQQKVSAELAQTNNDLNAKGTKTLNDAQIQSVKVLKDKIKNLEDERDSVSATSNEYKKYTTQIAALEKQVRAITGEGSKKTTAEKSAEKVQGKLKDLLSEISDAEREVNNVGLTSQQAEVARIEAKYDEFRRKAEELKADAGVFARIDKAEENAIGAERRQQRVDDYKDYLNKQQQLFAEYEKAKIDIGAEAAGKIYDEQTLGISSYIDFLKGALARLSKDSSAEGLQKRQAVSKQLADAEARREDELTSQKIRNIQEVLEKTTTFNIKRKQIEEKYQKDLAVLRETSSGKEFEERAAALKGNRDQELADLNSTAARSSDIYRKLNEDILLFTRQQLVARKRELEKYLATNSGIPPAVKQDIENYIKQLNGLISTTSDGIIDYVELEKVGVVLGQISQGFSQLASAVKEVDEEFADTLQTLADLTNVASNALIAIAKIGSGTDIVGGIAAGVTAIAGVFKIISDARKSVIQAQKEIAEFNLKVLQGEIDINVLYRERAKEQAKINALRLQGITQEARALKNSQQSNLDDYNRILSLLQKEQFVSGQRTEQYGGFLGIGRKTRVVDVYQSLAGKTYEDLEKLFLSGKLEGKAKELFQTLEKLKKEGLDIDAALQQNASEAKEIFTGTSVQSLTDQIAQGFQNGLRSAADFAQSFEDLMKGAILNALKYQTLEGPLKEFYDQFAKNAESDGVLTEEEIKQLRDNFNGIISNAGDKFEELQKITSIDFTTGNSKQQSGLAGAIKGITAEQADLLAGQFGGLRLTAVDQLRVASQGLLVLQQIEVNTASLRDIKAIWQRLEIEGMKIKP